MMLQNPLFLYAMVIFSWSTSWLPLSWQASAVVPEVGVLHRFIIATPLMALLAWRASQGFRFELKYHIAFMGLGLCLFSTNFTLFYYGSLYVASGLLAVAFATASLINILLTALKEGKAPPLPQLIASVIGLSGVGLVFLPEVMASGAGFSGLLFCIFGTLFFSTGNVLSSSLQKRQIPVLSSSSWGMFYGAVGLLLFSLIRGHDLSPAMTAPYIGGLLWLSVFSSVLAFACYLTLVGKIGAGKAGYVTIIFPVFALLISTVIEGYEWTISALIGITLVVIGNILMMRAK
ncbi:MAG: DMT family transporter, partial [Candidatus Puniceispirillaceae bacterium]